MGRQLVKFANFLPQSQHIDMFALQVLRVPYTNPQAVCMAFHPPTTLVVRRQSVITVVFPPLISQWARYSCKMAVKYHNNVTLKQYSQTKTVYAVHRG